jgi:hydrocephalus-inducing protein
LFEEQTVVPSLTNSANASSLYAIQEKVFWFGTLIASKVPEGVVEKFKFSNPNKIPCTVKFSVKPRTQSKNEGFAFEVSPASVKIPPHESAYVKVSFKPNNMMTYGGIFEAEVEKGDLKSSSGKLVFELKGEGTLPTLLISKPTELSEDGVPLLKLKKTRIGKKVTGSITLHNEGVVPATVKFKPIKHDNLEFKGLITNTLQPKEYYTFDIDFIPRKTEPIEYLLEFETLHNPYECHKVKIRGEGYQESITFENLPFDLEDELRLGDAIINKAKHANFNITNTSDKPIKFLWNIAEPGFTFLPSVGHLRAKSSKVIHVKYITEEAKVLKDIELLCESTTITQKSPEGFTDWDDSMTEIKLIRLSELKKIIAIKEAKERRRREDAEAAAAAAAKKGAKKPPARKEDEKFPEEDMPIDLTEEPSEEFSEPLPEPEFDKVEGSDKILKLMGSVTADFARYECSSQMIIFKATLMYATRSYKLHIRNTSSISLHYSFKITNPHNGLSDAGPFSISPRKNEIPAGTDEVLVVKFSPEEIEKDFSRILTCKIANLDPEQEPLVIKLDGVAERPVCHFELPPSTYREKKGKDMTPIDSKYSIIEFESLGTKVRNTKRFMVVNPTSHRYDFEWVEVEPEQPGKDKPKQEKPMFKCATPKGTILSGKKYEMVFEYTPDNVGEHVSYWNFRIPFEDIMQPFMVVGTVIEPIVHFETGKINFGPLLLGGKNKETINLINQEHIPFNFNFNKASIKENPDYGDSLLVSPTTGTIPPNGQIPIEVIFKPKYETSYNYNLV